MVAAGRASPSGTLDVSSTGVPPAPRLFPCWWGCPPEARQTPEGVQRWCDSWQVHSLSSSCHPLLLLLRAALCILKTSHPGCNVNNAEGRPSCGAKAGCLGRLGPYTWGAYTKRKDGYLGNSHCLWGCSGPFWEKSLRKGQSPQSSLRHTSVWEFVLMWRYNGGSQWRGTGKHSNCFPSKATGNWCLKGTQYHSCPSWLYLRSPCLLNFVPFVGAAAKSGIPPGSCFTPSVAMRPAGDLTKHQGRDLCPTPSGMRLLVSRTFSHPHKAGGDVLTGRASPELTSVAMTHSFLSSDIKHTDW